MMPITLVDMSVFQLFAGGVTQSYHLHIEVQLIPGQRMVKVQRHVIAVDFLDARIALLARIVSYR